MLQKLNSIFHCQNQITNAPKFKPDSKFCKQSERSVNKVIKWGDGTVYVGECQDNMMHGRGKLIFSNGQYYDGDFFENNFHGMGKYSSVQGVYEGEWQNGIKNGNARETSVDGSVYTGRFCNGVKQGMGVFEWLDGSYYEGMFKGDKISGPGKMIQADGSILQGEWQNNLISGYGKLKQPNGELYVGYFRSGSKHGEGRIIRMNDKIEGIWKNGILLNPMVLIKKDGLIYQIKMENQMEIKIKDEQFQQLSSEREAMIQKQI